MTDAARQAQGMLPRDEAVARFKDLLVPRHLTPAQPRGNPSARPTFVIVAGQPGAGKSRVEARVQARLGSGTVTIDADLFRQVWLKKEGELEASKVTHAQAVEWTKMAKEYCIAERHNVLLSTTMRTPLAAQTDLDQFGGAGYRVEVAALAVNKAASSLGVLSRFMERHEEFGFGRYVPDNFQRDAYDGFLPTLDNIDEQRSADAVYAYLRDGTEIYSNNLDRPRDDPSRRWVRPAGFRAAVEKGRARRWSAEESAEFRETRAELASTLPPELQGELQAIDEEAREYLASEPESRSTPDVEQSHDAADQQPEVEDQGEPEDRSGPADEEPVADDSRQEQSDRTDERREDRRREPEDVRERTERQPRAENPRRVPEQQQGQSGQPLLSKNLRQASEEQLDRGAEGEPETGEQAAEAEPSLSEPSPGQAALDEAASEEASPAKVKTETAEEASGESRLSSDADPGIAVEPEDADASQDAPAEPMIDAPETDVHDATASEADSPSADEQQPPQDSAEHDSTADSEPSAPQEHSADESSPGDAETETPETPESASAAPEEEAAAPEDKAADARQSAVHNLLSHLNRSEAGARAGKEISSGAGTDEDKASTGVEVPRGEQGVG